MLYKELPPSCQKGDTIAIVAPAGIFEKHLLEEGCRLFEEWGLQTTFLPTLYDKWGYLAGKDSSRAQQLQEAFENPQIRAIVCARGGYGCSRLVDLVNWEKIAKNPKRFLGFSDITFLHLALFQKTQMISFHSPMIASSQFLQGTSESQASVYASLFSDFISFSMQGHTLRAGSCEGSWIGGNLSLLVSTLGTPWQPCFENSILFLEDVNEPPYRIDRMFQQLKQANVFQQIKGLVLGDFGKLSEKDFWSERIGLPTHIPIIADVPIGHIANNHAVPCGAWGTLNIEKDRFSFSKKGSNEK